MSNETVFYLVSITDGYNLSPQSAPVKVILLELTLKVKSIAINWGLENNNPFWNMLESYSTLFLLLFLLSRILHLLLHWSIRKPTLNVGYTEILKGKS